MEDHANWGTSANIISRTLHAALAKRGEVTFIDAAEPPALHGRHFDAFLGIQRNFGAILESCSVDLSILVAVNMHPAEHNRILLDFTVDEHLPSRAMHALDLHDAASQARDIARADEILLFGNVRTLNSYTHNGVPSEKIRLVNYGTDVRTRRSAPKAGSTPPGTQLLYSASEIGLRKGFDVVATLMEEVQPARFGAHLTSSGPPHIRTTGRGWSS